MAYYCLRHRAKLRLAWEAGTHTSDPEVAKLLITKRLGISDTPANNDMAYLQEHYDEICEKMKDLDPDISVDA